MEATITGKKEVKWRKQRRNTVYVLNKLDKFLFYFNFNFSKFSSNVWGVINHETYKIFIMVK